VKGRTCPSPLNTVAAEEEAKHKTFIPCRLFYINHNNNNNNNNTTTTTIKANIPPQTTAPSSSTTVPNAWSLDSPGVTATGGGS
jgi:hypothetical protein